MFWYEMIYMLVYCLPLYFLCIRLTYVMWRWRKQFQSPFYRIVFIAGLVDCVGLTIHHFTNRLANTDMFTFLLLPYLKGFHWFLMPVNYVIYHCLHASLLSALLMAFNRLTSFMTFYYERIWKFQAPILFTCYIVVPFILVFYMLFNRAGFTYDDTKLWFTYTGFDYDHNITFGIVDSVVTFYYFLVLSFITFFINMANIVLLIRMKKKDLTKINRERQMMYSTLLIFAVQSVVMFTYLMFNIDAINIYVFLRFVLAPVTETLYLMPSLIMIMYVPPLRKAVFHVFHKNSHMPGTITAVHAWSSQSRMTK